MIKRSQCATAPASWWSALNAANQDGLSDGRFARSERTKRKIVDAALRMVDGGSERFTAGAVARRAGVSVRTLFTHYPEIEVLLDEVSNIADARIAELIRPIAPTLPLEQRIASFVDEQSRMFESMVGFHRALRLWRDSGQVAGRHIRSPGCGGRLGFLGITAHWSGIERAGGAAGLERRDRGGNCNHSGAGAPIAR